MLLAAAIPGFNRTAVNLKAELNLDLFDFLEWEQNVEDRELIAKADKIDLDLREIPRPEPEEFQEPGLWKVGGHGHEILYDEVRQEIRKAVRQRMPEYLKERRDSVEFYSKIITLILTVSGAAAGLIAWLTKFGAAARLIAWLTK